MTWKSNFLFVLFFFDSRKRNIWPHRRNNPIHLTLAHELSSKFICSELITTLLESFIPLIITIVREKTNIRPKLAQMCCNTMIWCYFTHIYHSSWITQQFDISFANDKFFTEFPFLIRNIQLIRVCVCMCVIERGNLFQYILCHTHVHCMTVQMRSINLV